ncbi:MAG: bifunctional 4-hydroxy-2-oxoglutarate aldolase/2-dehydro-3-deoxy-phosphogluconate aldolase [Clostridia bacterium]
MVTDIIEKIQKTGIVSIVRGIDEAKIDNTVKALYDGGIRAIEITLDTPGALRMIEKVKIEYEKSMTVGAGTALDPETARAAILAGADFILSPTLSVSMIEMCNQYSKLAVPGVLTPTEILTAWKAGAQIVKVFPARAFGPAYIKDIKGPLSQVQVMPVGGIFLDNASDFIKSGAIALGIGSELVNRRWVEEDEYDKITQMAQAFLEKVNSVRG